MQASSAVLHDVHIQVEQLAGLQVTELCSLLLGTALYRQTLKGSGYTEGNLGELYINLILIYM